MKPHETAFPCETPRLSFRMAGPSCTEGMVTYWPHSAAVTEAGACGGPCQGMHEGINGGGRKAGSQSQEKGLFRFAILSKETGNAVGTLECSSATEGDDSAKTMRIGLAGQHDSESYLEEALRFAVLTLIPAHALRGLRVIVPHAHERVSLLKQYGFEPSEEGGPALFQRADRTYFDAGKGMALCGLACCVCSENPTCAGCRNEGCKDRSCCQPFNCCKQKKLNGCWECPAFPCDNPMFNKQRGRAFAAFVLEHGEAALIRALQKNEADGVLYHYPGRLVGDYDLPESGSAIRAMLLRGLEAAQDAVPEPHAGTKTGAAPGAPIKRGGDGSPPFFMGMRCGLFPAEAGLLLVQIPEPLDDAEEHPHAADDIQEERQIEQVFRQLKPHGDASGG